MLRACLEIVAAYLLADLASGLYHYVTDRGWNFQQQIDLFAEHHDTNSMDGFDWQTFAAGLPISIAGAWFHSPFFVAAGIFVAATQVTHYYAHRRSTSDWVHALVRCLQRTGLIVHPKSHARHHAAPFDRDFCLLSGWNNWWLNRLLPKGPNS